MYVTILTYYFGAFDEDMVLYLTILTLIDLYNASYFSFAVKNLGCVFGGSIKEDMLICSYLSDLYGG